MAERDDRLVWAGVPREHMREPPRSMPGYVVALRSGAPGATVADLTVGIVVEMDWADDERWTHPPFEVGATIHYSAMHFHVPIVNEYAIVPLQAVLCWEPAP